MSSPATPSWAAGAGDGRAPRPDRPRPPVALVAAVAVVWAQSLAETFHVVGRTELVPGMRVFLVAIVVTQVIVAQLALARSAAGAFGLLLCEVTTLLAALAGGIDGGVRWLLAASAAVVIALVVASLGYYPAATLPPSEPQPGGSR